MEEIDNVMREVLSTSRVIAVVGLSSREERPSFEVARYLQERGYRIVPVNPAHAGTDILGERCHATLQDAAQGLACEGVRIDVVDCFRRPDAMLPIAEDAIAVGARCLWMQLGVVNEVAENKARSAGLTVISDHCIKIEHAHLLQ